MAESKSAALPLGDAPIRRLGHGPAESGRTIVRVALRCNGLGGDFAPPPQGRQRRARCADGIGQAPTSRLGRLQSLLIWKSRLLSKASRVENILLLKIGMSGKMGFMNTTGSRLAFRRYRLDVTGL